MKTKILCDRCHREFEIDEDVADKDQIICPDCAQDMEGVFE